MKVYYHIRKFADNQIMATTASSEALVSNYLSGYQICSFKVILWASCPWYLMLFSQKIQTNGLDWVLCDAGGCLFFPTAETKEIIITVANICGLKAEPILSQIPED